MIRVNLKANSISSETHQKVVAMLCAEMAADYGMPPHAATTLWSEHLDKVSNWINEKYDTSTKHFNFDQVGYGIEFEEDAFFTSMLLKVPAGKIRA